MQSFSRWPISLLNVPLRTFCVERSSLHRMSVISYLKCATSSVDFVLQEKRMSVHVCRNLSLHSSMFGQHPACLATNMANIGYGDFDSGVYICILAAATDSMKITRFSREVVTHHGRPSSWLKLVHLALMLKQRFPLMIF